MLLISSNKKNISVRNLDEKWLKTGRKSMENLAANGRNTVARVLVVWAALSPTQQSTSNIFISLAFLQKKPSNHVRRVNSKRKWGWQEKENSHRIGWGSEGWLLFTKYCVVDSNFVLSPDRNAQLPRPEEEKLGSLKSKRDWGTRCYSFN